MLRGAPSGTIVMDTKWKVLSGSAKQNFGISQADMYQMYAYGKKYGAEKVVLLYPRVQDADLFQAPIVYDSGDGVKVEIVTLDLETREGCVDETVRRILETGN